jgi:hypothetical protein
MCYVHPQSLADTLNAVNDALFFQRPIPAAEKKHIAHWIAGRQGLPHSYAGMIGITERDRRDGGVLFTGERVKCAACRHILGEESCRTLRLLNVADKPVRAALDRASESFLRLLHDYERGPDYRLGERLGTFCCGKCSVAYWRHLLAGGLDRQEARLAAGVRSLKAFRKGDGHWRVFPYHYTLLALVEMDSPEARAELKYAAPRCERAAKATRRPGDAYAVRRAEVARRVLERV